MYGLECALIKLTLVDENCGCLHIHQFTILPLLFLIRLIYFQIQNNESCVVLQKTPLVCKSSFQTPSKGCGINITATQQQYHFFIFKFIQLTGQNCSQSRRTSTFNDQCWRQKKKSNNHRIKVLLSLSPFFLSLSICSLISVIGS